MAYTTIDNPSETAFNTKLYTGTGSSNAITGVGFQPDWVWIKDRVDSHSHNLFDSVRGATKRIHSDTTDVETTNAESLKSFNSDGFTLGTQTNVNQSSHTNVAWCWKAGTSFTNDASATGIGATDSAGSVNETAGFSVCTYTGVGGTSTTIKHGLSTAPTVMLIKNRSQDDIDWAVYHQGIGNTHRLYLNSTDASTDAIGTFRDTSPTSSIFTVGDHASVNTSGETYVAYIFSERQGYSKFGSYTGNGNADGTFVYTGFKPAWVMCKITNTTDDWYMFNNKMPSYNLINESLRANTTGAQNSTGQIDFTAQGFKTRTSNYAVNGGSQSYIYMAFAENPFVTGSSGIPTTAR